MRRFRIYWGNKNRRTRNTLDEVLQFAETHLRGELVNVFDGFCGEDYICTVMIDNDGKATFFCNGVPLTREEVVERCWKVVEVC